MKGEDNFSLKEERKNDSFRELVFFKSFEVLIMRLVDIFSVDDESDLAFKVTGMSQMTLLIDASFYFSVTIDFYY